MMTRPLTVDRTAVANVLNTLPLAKAEEDLVAMLPRTDGLVLIEWGARDRWRLLAKFGRLRRTALLRRGTAPTGMTWAKALRPTGAVVGMPADRYELLKVRAVTLSGRTRVVPTERHPRRWKPANRALLTLWRDHLLDEDVAVIGYHLVSGVQIGRTGYRTDPAAAARVRLHKAQRARLEDLIAAHLLRDREVYAAGDSNYHRLHLLGLTSAWEDRPEVGGTLGNRDADDVHGTAPAAEVHRIGLNSDHDGVVTTRHRRRGDR